MSDRIGPFKHFRTAAFFKPHGSEEIVQVSPDSKVVFAPSYGTRKTPIGIYVDRIDTMAGLVATYGPFADYAAADDCARVHLLRDDVFREMDRFAAEHMYETSAGWTAEEIADDIPHADRSPALDGRDPADLVPFVKEWLAWRMKA
jgi:hypothetical protein